MFRGRFFHTIDAKGRVSIPSGYRLELQSSSEQAPIVTNAVTESGECLWLSRYEDWCSTSKPICASWYPAPPSARSTARGEPFYPHFCATTRISDVRSRSRASESVSKSGTSRSLTRIKHGPRKTSSASRRSLQAWIGEECVGERVKGVRLLQLRGWGGVPGVPIRGECDVTWGGRSVPTNQVFRGTPRLPPGLQPAA